MKAQEFLRKFSTKKDALTCINVLIKVIDSIQDSYQIQAQIKEWVDIRAEIESFQDRDLADRVMDLFNQTYGTAYKNNEKVKAIIRNEPKATFDQFASIIMHKKETWGGDPKMQEYLRPATLFGSVNKFKIYLDDATNYWIKKAKNDR
jgi:uncharacterized phage protein (TIGR02220 family)